MASAEELSHIKCARCEKPAKLQCPKCLELNLEQDFSAFCSQECFKEGWAQHKQLHKPSINGWHYCTRRGEGRALMMPEFKWTGTLRPYRIGPYRPVSSNSICYYALFTLNTNLCTCSCTFYNFFIAIFADS